MNSEKELKRLLEQGYEKQELIDNPMAKWGTRWTPFACVFFGGVGLVMLSEYYFFALSLLMLLGVFTSKSFYDIIYSYLFARVLNWGAIPAHGWHRKVGCALGALIYGNAGLQVVLGNNLLAIVPLLCLMAMALYAGINNWCFVTVVARWFGSNKTEVCCTNS